MSVISPPCGSSPGGNFGTLRRPLPERHAHETLHDFLVRRYDEMSMELGTLHCIVERQALTLRCERLERIQYECALILGQAWIAMIAAAVCWFFAPGALYCLAISVGLASMIGGACILHFPSVLEHGLGQFRSWRPK